MNNFEWLDTYDIIKERIKELYQLRDISEQEYYRAKLLASTKWEIEQALLIKEINYLKDWKSFLEEKMPVNDTIIWVDYSNWTDRTCKVEWEMKDWVLVVNKIDYE